MWINFFLAAASASAALAGLVFVALSVNIGRILQFAHLPVRAGAAIGTLMLVLVGSIAVLIPQSPFALGVEILTFGICAWALKMWAAYRSFAARKVYNRPLIESIVQLVLGQVPPLLFILGGILLMQDNASSFYWIAGGVITAFVFSVVTCWILLVEILR